jgi:urease accessory protein
MTSVASLPSERAAALPRLQRTRGEALVSFRHGDGRTRLDRLRQYGAAKIRLPWVAAGQPAQAVLINSAGGLTGGDRLVFRVEVGEGARALVTTQACEKIYRSRGDTAELTTTLGVGPGARLDWLPQETILFDRARLRRSLAVDLRPGASLLAVEAIIFGRTAMAERMSAGFFHDRWRIRRDGKLLFADDMRFDDDIGRTLTRPAALNDSCATATLVYVAADAEAFLDTARDAVADAGGVSAWNGKLVARLVTPDGLSLRRATAALAAILLGGAELPKVWHL